MSSSPLKMITHDGVQPKTSPFSTRHLIWVNYKVVSKLSQPIFISFSYLNRAQHNSVIELCCALKMFWFFYSYLVNWLTVLLLLNYWLFSLMQISIFITQESSRYFFFKYSLRKNDWVFLLVVYTVWMKTLTIK